MLRVSLLGDQTIADETPLHALTTRAVELAAFLIAHADRPQSRQRIAGALWPESGDAQALTNLRRELHHLRQSIGEDRIVVTPAGLCWRSGPDLAVDLDVFRHERAAALRAAELEDLDTFLAHATAAVEQYRGAFLPDCQSEWPQAVRAELEEQCVELYERLGRERRRRGDLPGAAEMARRRVAMRPLEESGYLALMQIQADHGDRAAAVNTYHACASVLDRELGVTPGAALQTAVQRLLATSGAAPAPVATVPRRATSGRAVFVGRDDDLAHAATLWRQAAAGHPGVVVLRGAPGVGKTRLLGELAARARRAGAVVAGSRCFGSTGRIALAPVVDWLREPAVHVATASLRPDDRAQLARLDRGTAGADDDSAGPRAVADSWQRHRFFDALAAALVTGSRPLLLTLDDVQWCDHETLQFLAYLLGRHPRATLLVAATLRDSDEITLSSGELARWISELRRGDVLREIRVGPLDVADTVRLAESISGRALRDEDTAVLHATTGGYPLYIVEAARASAGAQPHRPVGDLSAVLHQRLAQVSEVAREVAGLASAVRRNFSLDLLSESSDLSVDAVVHGVDELWERGIVREYAGGYEFSHDLLREAAYEQLTPAKRWLYHRRIAQSLELLNADDPDAVAVALAEHYAAAGRPDRAVTHYRRAAELASAVFAHDDAANLNELALRHVRLLPEGSGRDRQELITLEAMAAPLNARQGFSSRRLQEVLERTVVLAERLDARRSLLNALAGLWGSRFVQGRTGDAFELGKRALALAGQMGGDDGSTAAGHFAVGGTSVSLGRPADAVEHLSITTRLAELRILLPVGSRPLVHGQAWMAHAHWLLGDDVSADLSATEAVRLARELEHPYSLAVALAYAAITRHMLGERDALARTVTELGALCRRYGFGYYREWAVILRGWLRPGPAGVEELRAGIDTLKAAGSLARMPFWLTLLADRHHDAGRPHDASATLDAALVIGWTNDDVWWLPEVSRLRSAYDPDAERATARLTAARAMAAGQGSVALVRRCDAVLLATDGVRPSG